MVKIAFEKIGKLTGYEPKRISDFLSILDNFKYSGFCPYGLSDIVDFVLVALPQIEAHLPDKDSLPKPTAASEAGKCRSCGAAIVWRKTPTGRWCPFDLGGESHFKTCPQASRWSSKESNKAIVE